MHADTHLDTHTHMELVQTGSGLIDPGWRAAHYLHGPGWAGEDPNVKNMWLVFNASGASVNIAVRECRGQSSLESTSDL